MFYQILRMSEIDIVREKALALLSRDLKSADEISGWHQYIGEDRIGYVATAQGLLCLKYLKESHRCIEQMKVALEQSQFHDPSNNLIDGGWSILSIGEKYPTTGSTAWVLVGSIAGGEPCSSLVVQKGLSWLRNNQNDDGGWGADRSTPSRVYSTAIALRTLLIDEETDSKRVIDARRWLLGCQNKDGGWGERPDCPSTPVHTAHAVLALLDAGIDASSREIRTAIGWLYDQWDNEKMWENSRLIEQFEIPGENDEWYRIIYHYFPTPWVVIALLEAKESVFRKEIFNALKWIIDDQQDDGAWFRPSLRRKTLWAIHDALLAIETFMTQALTSHNVERLIVLDDILVLVRGGKEGRGIWRLLGIAASVFVFIGIVLGILVSSATGLGTYFSPFVQAYWSYIIFALYILSVFPLVRLRILSWKEVLLGMILPALLLLLQLYMQRP